MFVNVTSLTNSTINDLLMENIVSYSFMVTYNMLILILGLLGNIVLLVCSIGSGSLGMDMVSTMLMESIAVSHCLLIIIWYVPSLTTLLGRGWVLGAEMCLLTVLAQVAISAQEIFLIMAVSVYRLWKLLRPLRRTNNTANKNVSFLIAIITKASLTISCLLLAGGAVYKPSSLRCVMSTLSESMTPLTLACCITFIIIPMILLLSINLVLIIIVSRSAHRSRSKSARTNIVLFSISTAFVISYTPHIISTFKHFNWLSMLETYLSSLNAVATPFITFLAVRPFRRKVINKLRAMASLRSGCTISSVNDIEMS